MSDLSQSVISVFAELTWKRFLGLLLLAVITVCLFLAFERYTASFSLTRIQKAAEVLQSVHQLESSGVSSNPQLKEAYVSLLQQTKSTIATKPFSLSLAFPAFSIFSLIKFFCSFWPWSLLFLIFLTSKDSSTRLGITSIFVIMGVLSGTFAVFLPDHYWLNIIFYPVGAFLTIFIVIGLFGFYIGRRRTRAQKPEQGGGGNSASLRASP